MKLFLHIMLFTFAIQCYAQEEIDIAVRGISDNNKDGKQKDRLEAIMDAKRQACEKAGLNLESKTIVENFQTVYDYVESQAEAVLLPGFQIIENGYGEDGTYSVVLVGKIKIRPRDESVKSLSPGELLAHVVSLRNQVLERANDEMNHYWWYLLTLKEREKLLEQSVLLAVESMKRNPSPESKQAIQDGLALLTRPVQRMEHEGSVQDIAVSPNGKFVATASGDNTAVVWEFLTDNPIASIFHDESVGSVDFSPDSKYLATASNDGTARVWDVTSNKEVVRVDHDDRVNSVVFSPNGKYLATASMDSTARVWNVEKKRELARIKHEDRVRKIVFSPDSKYLATASGYINGYTSHWVNNIARVWDVNSGNEIVRMTHELKKGEKNMSVLAIDFSPDAKYLATSCNDGIVRIWELSSGEEIRRMKGARGDIQFSPDGRYIASRRVWEVKTGKVILKMPHEGEVLDVEFSPDGKYLVSGSRDLTARVWELSTGREVARMACRGNVHSVRFSQDGNYLITADDNNRFAEVWLLWPDDWVSEACSRLKRNLTPDEWHQIFGDEPYRKTCSRLP